MRLLFIAAAMLFAAPAYSQNNWNCAPRPVVLERLTERFGETRQSIGLGAQGAVVEVFASTGSGTWTITVTMPTGVTCLIASGQAFERLTGDPPPPGNSL